MTTEVSMVAKRTPAGLALFANGEEIGILSNGKILNNAKLKIYANLAGLNASQSLSEQLASVREGYIVVQKLAASEARNNRNAKIESRNRIINQIKVVRWKRATGQNDLRAMAILRDYIGMHRGGR
jgi:hypothetical protein